MQRADRALDYAPISPSIRRHRKTRRLARLLGCDLRVAYCYLVDLILECAEEYPRGVLVGVDADVLADICGYDGEPTVFCKALIASGWIDNVAGPGTDLAMVSWEKWGGKAIERRDAERVRKQNYRARVPRDKPGTRADVPTVSRSGDARGADSESDSESNIQTDRDPTDPESSLDWLDVERLGFARYGAIGGKAVASLRRLLPIRRWEIDAALSTPGKSWGYAVKVIETTRDEAAKGAAPRATNKPHVEGAFERVTREALEDHANALPGIPSVNDTTTRLLPGKS